MRSSCWTQLELRQSICNWRSLIDEISATPLEPQSVGEGRIPFLKWCCGSALCCESGDKYKRWRNMLRKTLRKSRGSKWSQRKQNIAVAQSQGRPVWGTAMCLCYLRGLYWGHIFKWCLHRLGARLCHKYRNKCYGWIGITMSSEVRKQSQWWPAMILLVKQKFL